MLIINERTPLFLKFSNSCGILYAHIWMSVKCIFIFSIFAKVVSGDFNERWLNLIGCANNTCITINLTISESNNCIFRNKIFRI